MIGFVALAIFITGSVFIILSNESSSVKNDSSAGGYENTVNSNASKVNKEANTNVAVPSVKTNTTTVDTNTSNPTKTVNTVVTPAKTVNTAATGFTMADVKSHGSSSNCWTAVYSNVYDVTSFISQHPGGSGAIISLCGRDGTSSFDNQHGGQRRANAELGNYKIGALLK